MTTVSVASAAEAAQAVRAAGAAGAAGVSCYRQPLCRHVHLDCRPMRALRFYQPGDLTVGAETGMTVAELNALLAVHGQFVPLDIACPDTTSLGAVLARHLSGPLRQRFGSVRDFTLGIEMVAADGSLVHAGGKVVKNVAGYDWMKPVIGGRGALGIITAVNFKVFPLPEGVESARLGPLSWPEVECLRSALLHSPLRPLALELHAAAGLRTVSVAYAGSAGVRARYRAELGKLALPMEVSEGVWPQPTAAVNACFAPAQAVAALAALGEGIEIAGRLGLGLFALAPAPSPVAVPADTRALMQRLQAALDPAGVFHGEDCAQ